ncbi:MAG: peptidoglycan DD-metalloendopeptidase family protein [Clostridiales bacterium]
MLILTKKTIVAILLCIYIIGSTVVLLAWSSVYAITVNGNPIAYVKTFQEGRKTTEGYLQQQKNTYGKNTAYNEKVGIMWLCRNGNLVFSTPKQGSEKLAKSTSLNTLAAVIVIDGKEAVTIKNEEIGENILQTFENQGNITDANVDVISKQFKGKVNIEPKRVNVSDIVSKTGAVALLSGNPVTAEPLAMVVEYTEKVAIPQETKVVAKDSLVLGTEEILYEGKTGEQKNTVRAVVAAENITEKEVIATAVISEPHSAVVVQGTKPVFYDIFGNGGFGESTVPLKGEITAVFGSHGEYWANTHTGIDIAAPVGTPVYSMGCGTVVSVRCNDVYGNIITINHGNGQETRYAHLSSATVKIGDVVEIGTNIGFCGNTGNVTGSHLHFEIRENGVFKDPILYFRLA